jgi:DNA polymerase-3 subunit chi
MGDVFFYHLTGRALDATAPELLEKCLGQGWRVTVRVGSTERAEALDDLLWRYRDDSFLPHGTARDGRAAAQPIYIAAGEETPNAPEALMLLDATEASAAEIAAMRRVMVLFDGRDAEAVEAARGFWRRVAASGAKARYWAETDGGGWAQRAESG